MIESNAAVSEALGKRFASDKGLYGSLDDIPLVSQKGHYRRMAILDSLPVGDVTNKVCVDFGTGSWGFAGIFPRLHPCKFAYGLDIAQVALDQSAQLSKSHNFPYGDRIQYLQSDGLDIPLPDASVDIIFSGESIEHTRLPYRFLSECHRVLRVGGQLIITTPNRDALMYKVQNDKYCVSPEHFWLFNAPELKEMVAKFFDVDSFQGFNGSINREMDKLAVDHESAEAWARQFLDQPELATGLILHARKTSHRNVKRYNIKPIPSSYQSASGPTQLLKLEFGLFGTMLPSPDSRIYLTCPPCDGMVMLFWTHRWSGITSIRCGDKTEEHDLYSYDGGWKQVYFQFETPASRLVEISATGAKDPRSENNQVIFFEAFTHNE